MENFPAGEGDAEIGPVYTEHKRQSSNDEWEIRTLTKPVREWRNEIYHFFTATLRLNVNNNLKISGRRRKKRLTDG